MHICAVEKCSFLVNSLSHLFSIKQIEILPEWILFFFVESWFAFTMHTKTWKKRNILYLYNMHFLDGCVRTGVCCYCCFVLIMAWEIFLAFIYTFGFPFIFLEKSTELQTLGKFPSSFLLSINVHAQWLGQQ